MQPERRPSPLLVLGKFERVLSGLTGASLFTCGGGSDMGMQMAGIDVRWGVEKEAERAHYAEMNCGHTVVAKPVEDVDFRDLPPVDVLSASPPCQGDSQARRSAKIERDDRHIGEEVVRYLRVARDYHNHLPADVFLENVIPYRKNPTFDVIGAALEDMGYWLRWDHVNAAEWGVPQSRQRLFLRASRHRMLQELVPTGPRVSWYEAIEDLLPGLPDDKIAPWQERRLKELDVALLLAGGNASKENAARRRDEPAWTVTAGRTNPMKALLLEENNVNTHRMYRDMSEPSQAVVTGSFRARALLLANGGYDGKVQASSADQPAMSVTTKSGGSWKALLENAICKRITPRCLARFQSFPDWYMLPEKVTLACEILGEAVPPLLLKGIIEQTINQYYN